MAFINNENIPTKPARIITSLAAAVGGWGTLLCMRLEWRYNGVTELQHSTEQHKRRHK